MLPNNPMINYKELGFKMFAPYVQAIHDPDVRKFLVDALNAAPEQFWSAPASSTGKYHPPESLGPGGLVRHTLKMVVLCIVLGNFYHLNSHQFDILISSAILHDSCKSGIPWGPYTHPDHGRIASVFYESIPVPERVAAIKYDILHNVRYHMSYWCPDEDKQYAVDSIPFLGRLLQLADYISSQKEVSFFPGVPVDLSRK